MVGKVTIKDFHGMTLGYIETKSNGDKEATNFYRQTVGYYDAYRDVTLNFYKQEVAHGDVLAMLIESDPSNKGSFKI